MVPLPTPWVSQGAGCLVPRPGTRVRGAEPGSGRLLPTTRGIPYHNATLPVVYHTMPLTPLPLVVQPTLPPYAVAQRHHDSGMAVAISHCHCLGCDA